jgi:hypothetical protein
MVLQGWRPFACGENLFAGLLMVDLSLIQSSRSALLGIDLRWEKRNLAYSVERNYVFNFVFIARENFDAGFI